MQTSSSSSSPVSLLSLTALLLLITSSSSAFSFPHLLSYPGALHALPSSVSFSADNFLFQWISESGHFQITDVTSQKVVWETLPSRPFIHLERTVSSFAQYSGAIRYRELDAISYDNQVLESVEQDRETSDVVLKGYIDSYLFPSYAKFTYELRFSVNSKNSVDFKVAVKSENEAHGIAAEAYPDRVILTYSSHKDEYFFGFGQQYPLSANLKGKKVAILVREQGLGRGLQPLTYLLNVFDKYGGGSIDDTYAPYPHYVTSFNRSLFLEGSDFAVFDLSKHDSVSISVDNFEFAGKIFSGNSLLDLITLFSDISGRFGKLPDWSQNGAIIGMEGGRDEVLHSLQLLKEFDVPTVAFWLQDWVGMRDLPWGKGLWWNWESDDERYPDWAEFVASMKSQNIRVLSYVNPMFVDVKAAGKPTFKQNFHEQLVEKNLAVRTSAGLWEVYVKAALVDLFQDEAREWMKNVLKASVWASGISGYMCDFGEAYPISNVETYDGKKLARNLSRHNIYPEEWLKLNREVITELGLEDEALIFNRAGFTQAAKYSTLYWLGDQIGDFDEFDGMKSAVVGLLSGGFSAISLAHSDIGGYNAVDKFGFKLERTKEVFFRWAEFSAFTVLFRTHYGSSPTENWQFNSDNETLAFFGRTAKIFVAWKFYRDELVQEAVSKGYPVARHLILHYPNDPEVISLNHQYMIGEDWVFAPVVDSKVERVSIYLPEGVWQHVWNDEVVQGPIWKSCNAPLGEPCVFVKNESSSGKTFIKNLKSMKLRV